MPSVNNTDMEVVPEPERCKHYGGMIQIHVMKIFHEHTLHNSGNYNATVKTNTFCIKSNSTKSEITFKDAQQLMVFGFVSMHIN